MAQLTKSPAWQALQSHHKTLARIHMRDLFAQEANRFERLSLRLDDLLLDYSKNRVTTRTLSLLLDLAQAAELPAWIERMFRGERINATERRAALHVALPLAQGTEAISLKLESAPATAGPSTKWRIIPSGAIQGAISVALVGGAVFMRAEHQWSFALLLAANAV